MRHRLVVLAAALLVLAALGVARGVEDQDSVQADDVLAAIQTSGDDWASEDYYRDQFLNLHRMMGVQHPQFGHVTHANAKRIRVLVLGDSFTTGTGLVDLEVRWPALLEERLDALTAPGTFEVVAVANGGSSTYSHLAWALDIASGDYDRLPLAGASDARPQLDQPFDAVVEGYVENDRFPGYFDKRVPKVLQPVAADAGFEDPTVFREVPLDTQNKIIDGAASDPNDALYASAVRALRGVFPDAPAVFAPLPYLGYPLKAAARDERIFAAAGFTVAEMPTVRKRTTTHAPASLMVTGVDWHPGPALHHAYAVDLAATLLDILPPGRVAAAQAAARPADRPLVPYVAPLEAQVSDHDNGVLVEVPDVAALKRDCKPFGTVAAQLECTNGKMSLRLGAPTERNDASTVVPPQFVPCVALGRPHVAISFDRRLPKGARVALSLDAKTPEPLDAVAFGYDEEGFEVRTSLGILSISRPLEIELGPRRRGVLLTPWTTKEGCATPNGGPVAVPALSVVVTRR